MASQAKTEEDRRKWPATGQPRTGLAKTHVAYWRDRVEKVRSRTGDASPNYSARICFKGRRVRFSLKTPNKEQAASKAAKIYSSLVADDWEETLAIHKPELLDKEKKIETTVGDLIRAASAHCTARPQTIETYCRSFRQIVAEIFEIPKGRKYDTRSKTGNATWRQRVESVPLLELTPMRVQVWKNKRLNSIGKDASAKRGMILSVNSIIRNCKALFSRRFIHFLREELDLPEPLPFEGITLERNPSFRYQSKIDAPTLMKSAEESLRDIYPESFKCFLLALVCALRASEIDWLLWDAFDFDEKTLRIEHTAYHRLKSEDSAGELDLSDQTVELFRDFAKNATSKFVIESDGSIDRAPGSGSYRCELHFKRLKTWLKANGVNDPKPIHTLRKECGSVIASEAGIFAASRYLRHSDIRVTSTFYADKKGTVVPGFAR